MSAKDIKEAKDARDAQDKALNDNVAEAQTEANDAATKVAQARR